MDNELFAKSKFACSMQVRLFKASGWFIIFWDNWPF